jgi:hypothetical protein
MAIVISADLRTLAEGQGGIFLGNPESCPLHYFVDNMQLNRNIRQGPGSESSNPTSEHY